MRAYRLEITLVVALIALVIAAYFIDTILPIFVLTVVGLPLALFVLQRLPRPDED
jgi:uncharacterized membrane protein YccC